MDKNSFDTVKELYSKGFRCIRYEDGKSGELTAYFKNFKEEKIDSVTCSNKKEIKDIKSFIETN